MSTDQLLLASVGQGGENRPEDIQALQHRFIELGYNWIEMSDKIEPEIIDIINLFQSIVRGRQTVSGDGRIDVPGPTYNWLVAVNSPHWQEMPVGSLDSDEGFYNYQVAEQPYDDHSFGTSWLAGTIREAGRSYEQGYRTQYPNAALLTINDASPAHGGDTPDHAGHETGLSFDIRLPQVNGTAGGIAYQSEVYDQQAMRAMLQILQNQGLVDTIYFNDPDLIDEGVCTGQPDHNNHAHIEIQPPELRSDVTEEKT